MKTRQIETIKELVKKISQQFNSYDLENRTTDQLRTLLINDPFFVNFDNEQNTDLFKYLHFTFTELNKITNEESTDEEKLQKSINTQISDLLIEEYAYRKLNITREQDKLIYDSSKVIEDEETSSDKKIVAINQFSNLIPEYDNKKTPQDNINTFKEKIDEHKKYIAELLDYDYQVNIRQKDRISDLQKAIANFKKEILNSASSNTEKNLSFKKHHRKYKNRN